VYNVDLILVSDYSAVSVFIQRLVCTEFVDLTPYKNTALLPLETNENAE
jgi:hypothetical protein